MGLSSNILIFLRMQISQSWLSAMAEEDQAAKPGSSQDDCTDHKTCS